MKPRSQTVLTHAALIIYSFIAVAPVLLIVMNSFKQELSIFDSPFALPTPAIFSLKGYATVLGNSNFPRYALNSLLVSGGSIALILLSGSMAAFALAEYRFRLNTLTGLYLALGVLVPIRLGTVGILGLAKSLHLLDTPWILILVYTAQGIPLAVFILTAFMKSVPGSIKEAARIDGAGEYRVFALVLPMVAPALGSVAAISLIPIWNDLWFPLILIASDANKTIVLGTQNFIGQYLNNWGAILAALSLAIAPAVLLYALFSRQLIRGLTEGAVK